MDPLRSTIAFAPLAAYLLTIGAVNLQRRPIITSGGRDVAALGVGLSGFFIVGPMELFMPSGLLMQLGGRALVWSLMLALYSCALILCVLSMRPRLVIYNVTADQLQRSLANVAQQLDATARWAGDALALPRLGVQLFVESPTPLRNAQLISCGPRQSFEGWRRLEDALCAELQRQHSQPNWLWGVLLAIFALLLALGATAAMLQDPGGVQQAWREMVG